LLDSTEVKPEGSIVLVEVTGDTIPNRESGLCVVVTMVPSGRTETMPSAGSLLVTDTKPAGLVMVLR
jgi:hypothetical protein